MKNRWAAVAALVLLWGCSGEPDAPVCLPQCQDRVCGDDRCGGSCGESEDALLCDAMGQFVGSICGNGTMELDEACDDGEANSDITPDACRTACVTATCGDGVVDGGEACDDSNVLDGDYCSADCQGAYGSCGDTIVRAEAGEVCDDGNIDRGDYCSSDCTVVTGVCGDGIVQVNEACDDGYNDACGSCNETCDAPGSGATCGDGVVCAELEGCDDGNTLSEDYCLFNCLRVTGVCGDGVVQSGVETCDDANSDNEDDCLNACVVAACGDGVVQLEVESCDDGNGDNADGCPDGLNGSCQKALCGDGFVRADVETCDDGNLLEGDYCSVNCLTVTGVCGDGQVQTNEACDDGNTDDGDYCSAGCDVLHGACGDGTVQADLGEVCDDGNSADDDYCSGDCGAATGACGDGTQQGNESCDDSNSVTETCDYGEQNCTVCDDGCKSVAGATSYCGDSVVHDQNNEICDEGGETTTCDIDCTPPSCGDGVLNATVGESCDNGEQNSDTVPDACRSTCESASCGDGVVDSSESCDDRLESAACNDDCTTSSCGDGRLNVTSGEVCDDGGGNSDALADACRTTCALASCGDAVVDDGESCDDGAESATCNGDCTAVACGDGLVNGTAGESCDAGGANSDVVPDGCRTTCLVASCGDVVVDSGEDCDDGAESATCNADCTSLRCGDGLVNVSGGEACDDGGGNSDVLADACRSTCLRAFCGDDVVDGSETCDDGNTEGGDYCSADCSVLVGACGDGVVNSEVGELCDDSNTEDGDYCSSDCGAVTGACGDDVVQGNEACDDGYEDACGSCSATCDGDGTGAVCGDGQWCPELEVCDDGNTLAGDHCFYDCQRITGVCGDGVVHATVEECDDGNDDNSDACLDTCKDATCGDGNVQAGVEGCDDGNADNSDACPDGAGGTCEAAACGDGLVQASVEACDDGNTVSGDYCSAGCDSIVGSCGDSIEQINEACDDGNTDEGDYCSGDCTISHGACGDGVVKSEVGEICDDGNTVDGDYCSLDCSTVTGACGDLNIQSNEDCDDGNIVTEDCDYGEQSCVVCDGTCADVAGVTSYCGDSLVDGANNETCDEGGESATCDSDCTAPSCGDGELNTAVGESCDNGEQNSDTDPDACRSTCVSASCGDGVVDSLEVCDDRLESAACNDDCTASSCGDGRLNVTSGESCDDGAGNSDVAPDGCRSNCLVASCGDGVVDDGEVCDDGGESASCDDDCTVPVCGDGVLNQSSGEACDEGGETAGCDADCTLPVCGDSVTNAAAGEACDDGNTLSGDYCSFHCLVVTGICGDGVVQPTLETCDDGNADGPGYCLDTCECNEGYEAGEGATGCTKCPAGHYSNGAGDCAPCTGDNYLVGADENLGGGTGCQPWSTCGRGSGATNTPSNSANTICAPCDYITYPDMDQPGEDLGTTEQKSSMDACHAWCLEHPECSHFLYKTSDGTCWRKYGDLGTGAVTMSALAGHTVGTHGAYSSEDTTAACVAKTTCAGVGQGAGYYEDFNGDFSNWTTSDGDWESYTGQRGSSATSYTAVRSANNNGEEPGADSWSVWGPAMSLSGPDGVPTIKDVTLTVDAYSTDNDGWGFFVRYKSATEPFYRLAFSNEEWGVGKAKILKGTKSDFTVLDSAESGGMGQDAWTMVTFSFIGDAYKVIVDGNVIMSGTDADSLAGGTVGVYVSYNHALYVDNLTVAGEFGPKVDDTCATCGADASAAMNELACRSWTDCVAGEYESTQPDTSTHRVCTGCAADKISTTPNAVACSSCGDGYAPNGANTVCDAEACTPTERSNSDHEANDSIAAVTTEAVHVTCADGYLNEDFTDLTALARAASSDTTNYSDVIWANGTDDGTYPRKYLIDGDDTTMFHTHVNDYDNPVYDAQVIVDLGQVRSVRKVEIKNRTEGGIGGRCRIHKARIYTSTNKGCMTKTGISGGVPNPAYWEKPDFAVPTGNDPGGNYQSKVWWSDDVGDNYWDQAEITLKGWSATRSGLGPVNAQARCVQLFQSASARSACGNNTDTVGALINLQELRVIGAPIAAGASRAAEVSTDYTCGTDGSFSTPTGIKCQPKYASCKELKRGLPGATSGYYDINPDGPQYDGGPITQFSVYCDMDSGSGYTHYYVESGTGTDSIDDDNICKSKGLMLFSPTNKKHYESGRDYVWKVLQPTAKHLGPLGIYRKTAGAGFANCGDCLGKNTQLNSGIESASSTTTMSDAPYSWKSLAGENWWASDIDHGEPNGDYAANCWMGYSYDGSGNIVGYNDLDCGYNHTTYLCMAADDRDTPDGEIRLTGNKQYGTRAEAHRGKVEIFHDGHWGTICDDDVGGAAAKVICRQLGFPDGDHKSTSGCGDEGVSMGTTCGSGSFTGEIDREFRFAGDETHAVNYGYPIWVAGSGAGCGGAESALKDCGGVSFEGPGGDNGCAHDEDLGVLCDVSSLESKTATVGDYSGSTIVDGKLTKTITFDNSYVCPELVHAANGLGGVVSLGTTTPDPAWPDIFKVTQSGTTLSVTRLDGDHLGQWAWDLAFNCYR